MYTDISEKVKYLYIKSGFLDYTDLAISIWTFTLVYLSAMLISLN